MKKFLTALLCTASAFCLCIGLSACDNDKKEEIALTADTDFTALVSEKVDEAGWKKALTLKDYDVNFTNGLTVKGGDRDETYTVKYNINELFYHGTVVEPDETLVFETSLKKDKDETLSYYYYDYEDGYGVKFKVQKDNEDTEEEYAEYSDLYKFYKVMYCPDFSDSFSSFTYDETKHSYVCSGEVEGTVLFESFNEDGLPDKEDYKNVEIKIVNGRLAYLTATYEDYLSLDKYQTVTIKSYFYDFGKTTITYKDVEEMTEPLE